MTDSASITTALAESQPRPARPWEWVLAVVLMVGFVLQVQAASPQKSAAFDEQYHLAAGYSYLRTGDFRMATTHPPLAGMLAALPLLTRDDINLPLDHPTWEAGNRFDFSDVFLWYANEDPQGFLIPARAAITVLGVILLVALLLWARRLLGMSAALLVLTLAAFDPNLIANARVVTTDLALTTFLLLATWRLWAWLQAGRWYELVLLGLFGGLAMATKYNALLFWPIALAVALLHPVQDSSWARSSLKRLGALVLAGMVGVFVVWGIYRFDFGALQAIAFPLPVPAPFYWDRLWLTLTDILDETGVKPDFLLGQVSSGGWWYYFPVAIGVKTPLPSLLFCLAGLAALAQWGGWRRQAALWVPPLAFLVLGLTGILTIGYRHLLPAVPFALLLAGNSLRWGHGVRRSWIPATVVGVLVAWLVFGSLRIWPHQEAFFNELAGDWPNWSNILVDSNLDWGQDLPALRATMDELGIDRVNLGYFGKAAPEKYGVRYSPLPGYLRFMVGRETDAYNPYTPSPGWYAISATSLRLGTLQPETADMYAYFRPLTPAARAGYSIYLYHVEPDADEAVVRPVVTGQPVWQIPPDQLGVGPGTRVQTKWTQSLASTIYPLGEGFARPDDGTFVAIDADFDGVFTLLGYQPASASTRPGQDLSVVLYWQVGPNPMPQPAPTRGAPLSAFVHVIDGDPANVVTQFDGWEVALQGLEAGDVIAQQVIVPVGEEVKPGSYELLAGLYSQQNWSRLPVTQGEESRDHARLGSLEVTP